MTTEQNKMAYFIQNKFLYCIIIFFTFHDIALLINIIYYYIFKEIYIVNSKIKYDAYFY